MPRQTYSRFSSCATDLVHFLYLLSIPVISVVGLLYLIFSKLTVVKFATFGAIIGSWFLVFLVVVSVDILVRNKQKEEVDQLITCRTNLLIGSGSACLISWIPRIAVCFATQKFGYEDAILCYLIFVCIPTISLIWCAFIAYNKPVCEVLYNKNDILLWLVFTINFFLFLITISIEIRYDWYEDSRRVIWTQIGFFPISTACMLEFGQVWSGRLRLTGVEQISMKEKRATERSDPVENDREMTPASTSKGFILECKICMFDFNDVKIPRILKECGHSLCEECANVLLSRTNDQYLFCPFCQKLTIVNGKANTLPKNYTITELFDEKKKLNKMN
ncbi:hypothetical protein CAEBREN_20507 [Caenorhabditis brenneri]|uniref:RING-type domain-containing protein n=1 Tax=Caenorhabditis brenneri TaxID=135651 RepID=G0PB03_CAEBE|nr:hypothetical protein CAEBREN_20507 [Caenorhabditis brenneri]